MKAINQGNYRPKTTLTFREFIETQWQPNLFPTFKFSTCRGYTYMLRKYLLPSLGGCKMTEITRQSVQALVAQLGRHLAPKSVCLAKNLLSKVFTTAIEWGYVEQNPATGVRLPPRISHREPIALFPEQIRQLIAELPEPCKSMVLIAVLTGLRRGELFALRWSAVDFERKLIHVRESVYEGQFNSPKTRSSFRKIPMGEALEQIFLLLKGKNEATSDLVFASKRGTALRPENTLKRVIHPACARIGLSKVGWHDLRHTSATLLHEHEPLRVTQAILGHSDMQTTLGYTHVLPGWQRDAMNRLERAVLFPNVPKSSGESRSGDFTTQ
ncbi:MAG: tyrosine-type recombinase/integrase [Candidatus Acidiferrales bacterium]